MKKSKTYIGAAAEQMDRGAHEALTGIAHAMRSQGWLLRTNGYGAGDQAFLRATSESTAQIIRSRPGYRNMKSADFFAADKPHLAAHAMQLHSTESWALLTEDQQGLAAAYSALVRGLGEEDEPAGAMVLFNVPRTPRIATLMVWASVYKIPTFCVEIPQSFQALRQFLALDRMRVEGSA